MGGPDPENILSLHTNDRRVGELNAAQELGGLEGAECSATQELIKNEAHRMSLFEKDWGWWDSLRWFGVWMAWQQEHVPNQQITKKIQVQRTKFFN